MHGLDYAAWMMVFVLDGWAKVLWCRNSNNTTAVELGDAQCLLSEADRMDRSKHLFWSDESFKCPILCILHRWVSGVESQHRSWCWVRLRSPNLNFSEMCSVLSNQG